MARTTGIGRAITAYEMRTIKGIATPMIRYTTALTPNINADRASAALFIARLLQTKSVGRPVDRRWIQLG